MIAQRSYGYGLVIALLLAVSTKFHVASSASPHLPPTSSPSLLPSTSTSSSKTSNADGVEKSSTSTSTGTTTTTTSSTTLTYEDSPNKNVNNHPPSSSSSSQSRPKSSSVTFLYELYEQEIYDPKTDGWASRRFTQSPVTGGGGRDSTSLDPQSCSPPRNYLFDGEWKIDMASQSRDGFGWEYYVGKYDGLGRRRRRWVRTLKRVSIIGSGVSKGAAASAKKLAEEKKKLPSSLARDTTTRTTRTYHPSLLRAIKDQYNFKGFGWAFYKSFLFARSVGVALRIPLSANFDCYDKYLAAPYISSATYFGYPWVVATFLNASLPLDAVKWFIGGILWKMRWSLAVVSALVRIVLDAALWIVLWPWRLWRATVELTATLARFGAKKQEEKTVESVVDRINKTTANEDATNTTIIETGEGITVSIETHIELSNSTQYKDNGEPSAVSATAVVGSPRGGATNTTTEVSSFRKKHLTLLGNKIPTFHRTTTMEYSSTVQERIGAAISWRVSQERGFEFRWNLVYTCFPTVLLWGQLEAERKRQAQAARRRFVGIWGKANSPSLIDKVDDRSESKSQSKSRSKSQSKPPILSSFLNDHSSTLGLAAGWPLPMDPYFSFNLMLSLSEFYYGWLLKFIRSLFVLPLPSLKENELRKSSSLSAATNGSAKSEKLVSSALKKKKLPVEESVHPTESDDEAASVLLESDSEECSDNSTSIDLKMAGL